MMVIGMLGLGMGIRTLFKPVLDYKIDQTLDESEAEQMGIWLVGGLAGVVIAQAIIMQIQVPQSSFTTSYQAALTMAFFVAVAVSEEIFFRFFLYVVFRKFFARFSDIPNWLIANLLVSLIFVSYHLVAYSTVPLALIAVFVSSAILCLVYEFTNRITVTITIHVFVNAIASGYLFWVFTGGGILA